MWRILLLLGAAVLVEAPPAAAETAAIPCTCRAAGASHAVGAVVCLATPGGPRLARCGRVLNNTSWTLLEAPCPTAGLRPSATPRPAAALPAPATAAAAAAASLVRG